MIDYTAYTTPEKWWKVHNAFRESQVKEMIKLFPKEVPEEDSSGKRDSANKFRTFITRNTKGADIFKDWDTLEMRLGLSDITGVDMKTGALRIELCQDGPGFWLSQHVDIKEKLMTLQIYLGEGKESWGTVLYAQPDQVFTELPFKSNTGWLGVLGEPVIHGVPKKKVDGVRKSVIINYVTSDWKDTDQLY